jgi:hypothetical protein
MMIVTGPWRPCATCNNRHEPESFLHHSKKMKPAKKSCTFRLPARLGLI